MFVYWWGWRWCYSVSFWIEITWQGHIPWTMGHVRELITCGGGHTYYIIFRTGTVVRAPSMSKSYCGWLLLAWQKPSYRVHSTPTQGRCRSELKNSPLLGFEPWSRSPWHILLGHEGMWFDFYSLFIFSKRSEFIWKCILKVYDVELLLLLVDHWCWTIVVQIKCV